MKFGPLFIALTVSVVDVSASLHGAEQVIFRYSGPGREVFLVGDFNEWRREPMKRTMGKGWMIEKILDPDMQYRYGFRVDGKFVRDPLNPKAIREGKWTYSLWRKAPLTAATSPAGDYRSPPSTVAENLQHLIETAQQLSYAPEKMDESIAVYRYIVADHPTNRDARLGLARVLSWKGKNREANHLFEELLNENPSDKEAILGRAQIARWTGDRRGARWLLRQALRLDPNDPKILAESTHLELASHRYGAARRRLEQAKIAGSELPEVKEAAQKLTEATQSWSGLKSIYSEESTPFYRFTQIGRGEIYPASNLRLRPEAGFTQFSDGEEDLQRHYGGISIRQTVFPGFFLEGSWRHHIYNSTAVVATTEWMGQIAGRPFDGPIEMRAGVRRRALADLPAGYEEIGFVESSGAGGSTMGSIRNRMQIQEEFVSFALSPIPLTYVYADGIQGTIDDENERRSLATGIGFNVFPLLGINRHSFTLKLDYYALSFEDETPDYFSPDSLHVVTPGASVIFNIGRAAIGLEGGQPQSKNETGYIAGGFLSWPFFGNGSLYLRGRISDDTAFRTRTAIGGLSVPF